MAEIFQRMHMGDGRRQSVRSGDIFLDIGCLRQLCGFMRPAIWNSSSKRISSWTSLPNARRTTVDNGQRLFRRNIYTGLLKVKRYGLRSIISISYLWDWWICTNSPAVNTRSRWPIVLQTGSSHGALPSPERNSMTFWTWRQGDA